MKRLLTLLLVLSLGFTSNSLFSQDAEEIAQEEEADAEAEEEAEEAENEETNDEAESLEEDGTVTGEYGPIGSVEFPSIIDGESTGYPGEVDDAAFADLEEAAGGDEGLGEEEAGEESMEEEGAGEEGGGEEEGSGSEEEASDAAGAATEAAGAAAGG